MKFIEDKVTEFVSVWCFLLFLQCCVDGIILTLMTH